MGLDVEEQIEVVIVGGGIAGLATAVALQRFGVQRLLVLERSHELRSTGAALSLFPNAWRALDALGVAHKLTSIYPEFHTGSLTNLENGGKMTSNFSKNRVGGTGVRAVHRKILLEALAEELRPDTIRFSSKLASIKISEEDPKDSTVTLHLEDGAVIRTKVLIGCDGVQSVVAQWLGLAAPVDSGRAAVRGLSVYKEGHGLEKGPKQFLSSGRRAGFAPLNDYEVYWFITHTTTQREREMARDFFTDPSLVQKEVEQNLAKDFPEVYLDVVRHSDLSSVTWAPLMLRAPWNIVLGPMQRGGGVTVAGDAMHPMTPDLGQGGCSALEDAVVLARCIGPALISGGAGGSGKEVEEGMKKYVGERKWRVAGLVVGSYMSGWVQQGGGSGLWGWFVGWFRDHVFYRFLFTRIASAANCYDCGDLPKLE